MALPACFRKTNPAEPALRHGQPSDLIHDEALVDFARPSAVYYDEGGHNLLLVENGSARGVHGANLATLLAGPELPTLDFVGAVTTKVQLARRVTEFFHGAAYQVLIAFPDGWSYGRRLLASRTWAQAASHARISGAAQMAALGHGYFGRLDRELWLLVAICEPNTMSLGTFDSGDGVVEILRTRGAESLETLKSENVATFAEALWRHQRANTNTPPPDAIVVTGSGSSAFVKVVRNHFPNVPVLTSQSLVAKGFITQIGVFLGAVKHLVLLATWPHTTVEILELPPSGIRNVGDTIPAKNGAAVLVDSERTIPFEASAKLAINASDSEVWLAEFDGRGAKLLAQIPVPPQARRTPLKIGFEVDADMHAIVSVPALGLKRSLADFQVVRGAN